MPEPRHNTTRGIADSAAHTGTHARDASTAQGTAQSAAPVVPSVPGYEVLTELGQGAMGVVYQARDMRLNRIVALKMVLGGPQADANRFVRFLVEAEAVAAIKHPHVVQVYEFGEAQGHPFLALEYLPGGTLSERLGRPLGTRAAIELLIPIARAVAASHELGIVHRDLKPGNVLFTETGLPKVTDFGLAKLGAGTGLTESHAFLGTPAYMSPEQAWGNAKFVGPQADVWAVGVMLYEAITGQRPFQGETVRTLLTRIVTTDPVPPRKLVPAIPRDLELICLKCLAKQAHERYPTAKELADDLERLNRGDSISVRPPGLAERAGKWALRNKVVTGAAALLLTMGAAFAWWADRQRADRREAELRQQLKDERQAEAERQRLSRNGEAVASLLKQCQAALASDDAPTADTLFKQALTASSEGGTDHLAEQLARLQAELTLLHELNRIDERRWASVDGIAWVTLAADEHWPPAFKKFGIVPGTTPVSEVVARINASPINERILTAFHLWLLSSRSPELLAILDTADPDEYRHEVRLASLKNDLMRLRALASQEAALSQPVWFMPMVGEHHSIPVSRRGEVLGTTVLRYPDKLSAAMALGTLYPIGGREAGQEREKWMRVAVAVRPTSAVARNNLGVALYEQGRLEEALVAYQEAARLDPGSALAHSNLAATLTQLGRPDEAVQHGRLATQLDPGYVPAHNSLGNALLALANARRDRGEPHEPLRSEAISEFRTAIAIQPGVGAYHNNLGNALDEQGDARGAIAAYEQAILLDPLLAESYANLGSMLGQIGDYPGAVTVCRAAITLKPSLQQAHSTLGESLHYLGDLDAALLAFQSAIAIPPHHANIHNNFGLLLRTRGDMDGAIAEFQRAVQLDPRMAKAHSNLGLALYMKGDRENARRHFTEAIRLDPNYAEPHNHLGRSLLDQNNVDGAIAEFEIALKLAPAYAAAHHNRGLALHQKGDFPAAIKAYRKAIELHNMDANYFQNLGIVLAYTDDLDGAIAAYSKAIALNPNFAQAHNNLAAVYLDRKQYPQAIASAREAIRANPKYAIAYALLGMALHETGDTAGARAALTSAARLDPKRWNTLLAQLPPVPVAPPPREVKN